MGNDLKVQCQCGVLQGVASDVSPAAGSHVTCYCEDCQAFAHFLDKSASVLDTHGGSNIFQMSQGKLTITTGKEHLACMRLTGKGLLRWYASCCNTPLGNTMSSTSLPFVGLVTTCLEANGGALRDQNLGPVIARVYRKSAKGDRADLPADQIAMPLVFLRAASLLIRWKLRGDSRRSTFFDTSTGDSVVSPRVLTSAERADLRAKVAGALAD